MNKYTVDRIEGEYAVLLLRPDEVEQIDILVKNLPSQVKEGDILEMEYIDNKITHVKVLKEEAEQAKKSAEGLIQKLINKNKNS